jgi:hypothetical protein
MQRPSAHITKQGAVEMISGATPTAVSQSQPKAKPVPPMASPETARTRRSRIQYSIEPAGDCADEPGTQHDIIVVLGISPDEAVEGMAEGFVASKLSMIFVLLQLQSNQV